MEIFISNSDVEAQFYKFAFFKRSFLEIQKLGKYCMCEKIEGSKSKRKIKFGYLKISECSWKKQDTAN